MIFLKLYVVLGDMVLVGLNDKKKQVATKRLNKKEPKKELTAEQNIKLEVKELRSQIRKLRKEIKDLKDYLHNDYYKTLEEIFNSKYK